MYFQSIEIYKKKKSTPFKLLKAQIILTTNLLEVHMVAYQEDVLVVWHVGIHECNHYKTEIQKKLLCSQNKNLEVFRPK